jgi:hypothetical protein
LEKKKLQAASPDKGKQLYCSAQSVQKPQKRKIQKGNQEFIHD